MMEALLLVGQLLKTLSKAIGIRGYIILGLIGALGAQHVYYEGLPIIRSIPVIGKFAGGRVRSAVNEAVAGAQHAYAVASENAAKKAKADAEAESMRQAQIVTDEYSRQLDVAQATDSQKDKDLKDALEQNAALRKVNGLRCDPDDATRKLLRDHGFRFDP